MFPARTVLGFFALGFISGRAAGAEPERLREPSIRSYGDTRAVNVADELSAFLEANAGLVAGVPAKPVTFQAALARARALAKEAGSVAVLAALKKRLSNPEPAAYRALAVIELARGNIPGVLVLLVAALDLAPDDADNLFNLASILATLNHPNESLALLDELARRRAAPTPPMGLTGADLADYLRGYSLTVTGNLAAARPLLERVRDRQPLLAEAPRTLALIDEKEGNDPRKNFLLGVWRHRHVIRVCGTGGDETEAGDPLKAGEEVSVDAEELLDWGKARRGALPTVPFAATMEAATSMRPGYEKLAEAEAQRGAAIQDARDRFKAKTFNHTERGPEDTWGGQMHQLIQSYFRHFPKIAEADRELRAAGRARSAAFQKIYSDSNDKVSEALLAAARKTPSMGPREMGVVAKPFRDAALAAARPALNREETAMRKRFDLWHQMATAVGGAVGDAAWRGWIQGTVNYERAHMTRSLLTLVSLHAELGEQPFYDAPPVPPPGNSDSSDLAACDGSRSVGVGLGELGMTRGLSPVTLSAELSCEGFSMEIGVEVLPMIGISTEFGVNTKGEISAFVGPKFEAGLAGVGGGSVKGGLYVTGGRDGVHDVGVRAEAKTLATLRGSGAATKVGESSFSFVPGPASRPPVADLEPLVLR